MRGLVVALALVTASAAADPRVDPHEIVSEPLVLGAGAVDVRLTAEVNLQKARYGRPLSLAPDLWFGVSDRWTVGVTHSNASVDRIDADATFCVREYTSICDRLYRGSALDVRWGWRDGALAVAPRGRLVLRDVDPVKPALTAGALVRWTRGRYRIASDPYLRIGLSNRDLGNRDALVLPLWLGIQPTCRWLVEVHTGWDGELATWRDGWHIPFGLAVRARPIAPLEVGFEAGFASLLGPQNNIKQRAVMITVGWRTDR